MHYIFLYSMLKRILRDLKSKKTRVTRIGTMIKSNRISHILSIKKHYQITHGVEKYYFLFERGISINKYPFISNNE